MPQSKRKSSATSVIEPVDIAAQRHHREVMAVIVVTEIKMIRETRARKGMLVPGPAACSGNFFAALESRGVAGGNW